MRWPLALILLASVTAGGCHSLELRHDSAGVGLEAFSGDRIVTGLVVALMIADAAGYYAGEVGDLQDPADSVSVARPAPPISEQDCTRPIDPTRGNLRCR